MSNYDFKTCRNAIIDLIVDDDIDATVDAVRLYAIERFYFLTDLPDYLHSAIGAVHGSFEACVYFIDLTAKFVNRLEIESELDDVDKSARAELWECLNEDCKL